MRAFEKLRPPTNTMQKEARMSRINSRDRNVRIVAITASILFGLTVGAAADGGGYNGGWRYHKPVTSSYDPAKSVVRDHRTPVGHGASAIPNAGKRQ